MNDVLMNEKPVFLSQALATMLGLDEAIFLEWLHEWLQESRNVVHGKPWVEDDIEAWSEELFFMAPCTMRRILERLLKLGMVEVSLHDGARWYTLAYEKLEQQVAAYRAKHGMPTQAEGDKTI